MTIATWLAFLLASVAMPAALPVIGQSLGAGPGQVPPPLAGVALSELTAITLSLAALGATLTGRRAGSAARPATRRVFNRIGSSVSVRLGIATAAVRHA